MDLYWYIYNYGNTNIYTYKDYIRNIISYFGIYQPVWYYYSCIFVLNRKELYIQVPSIYTLYESCKERSRKSFYYHNVYNNYCSWALSTKVLFIWCQIKPIIYQKFKQKNIPLQNYISNNSKQFCCDISCWLLVKRQIPKLWTNMGSIRYSVICPNIKRLIRFVPVFKLSGKTVIIDWLPCNFCSVTLYANISSDRLSKYSYVGPCDVWSLQVHNDF